MGQFFVVCYRMQLSVCNPFIGVSQSGLSDKFAHSLCDLTHK